MRLIFIMLFFSQLSFGQIQIKGGVNMSQTTESKSRMGYQLGVGKDFKIENLILVPEAMFSLKRAMFTGQEIHMNYIEQGLLVGYEKNDKYIFAGNAISVNVYSKSKTLIDKEIKTENANLTNNIDWVQVFGFGYKVKAEGEVLFLEARGSFGTLNQYQKSKNISFGIVAGIYF
jgi:hypothetical protein